MTNCMTPITYSCTRLNKVLINKNDYYDKTCACCVCILLTFGYLITLYFLLGRIICNFQT